MYLRKKTIRILIVISYLITTGISQTGCSSTNTIYRSMPDDFSLDMVVLASNNLTLPPPLPPTPPTSPTSSATTTTITSLQNGNKNYNQRFIVESDGSLRANAGDMIHQNKLPGNIRRLSLDQMYELWQLYQNINLQKIRPVSTQQIVSPTLLQEQIPAAGSAYILWVRANGKAKCLQYDDSVQNINNNSTTKMSEDNINPFSDLLQKLTEYAWLEN